MELAAASGASPCEVRAASDSVNTLQSRRDGCTSHPLARGCRWEAGCTGKYCMLDSASDAAGKGSDGNEDAAEAPE